MTNIETNPGDRTEAGGVELPNWYRWLVCLGSAIVGGFFGSIYEFTGVLLGALGGAAVAVFWLKLISTFRTQSVTARIFGGIGWGIVAGLMDTVWLHVTGLAATFHELSGAHSLVGFEIVFVIALVCGVGAGAIYGLLCMIVLEIYRASTKQEQE